MRASLKHFCSEPPHKSRTTTKDIFRGAVAEMAVERGRCWPNGSVLRVSFIGGSRALRERIAFHAGTWMEYANITFDFNPADGPAEIRIAFRPSQGTWSCLGDEALEVPAHQPTMNFSDIRKEKDDAEVRWVVLHEFGHALGCVHEHQRPDNGIPWNLDRVYAFYKDTNNWSKEDTDAQVLDKYNQSQLRNGSFFDPKSIMIYAVPEYLTKGWYHVKWNYELSEEDKRFIGEMYPGRE